MMIKKHLKNVILLLFILFSFSFIQEKENKIYWTKDYQLSWDDFQEQPPTTGKIGAVSRISVGIHWERHNNIIEISGGGYFNKAKSWSRKDLQTDEALKHEQGHFDIAELYARKLKKELKNTKFKSKNVDLQLPALVKKVDAEHWKYQDLYDEETLHHKNVQKQLEWNKRIAKELKALEAYTEPDFIIKVK